MGAIAEATEFRHFMTLINYESFGNPPSGQKKRVTVVPSPEWSPGKGLYYHALMDPGQG
jgi:hypothetical protein